MNVLCWLCHLGPAFWLRILARGGMWRGLLSSGV